MRYLLPLFLLLFASCSDQDVDSNSSSQDNVFDETNSTAEDFDIVTDTEWSMSEYPSFSWDNVQVCLQFSRSTSDYTSTELNFMARFPIVVVEKTQSLSLYDGVEVGTSIVAEEIKSRNADSKVLFYWSTFNDMGEFYKGETRFLLDASRSDWAWRDESGNLLDTMAGIIEEDDEETSRVFDVTNSDMRIWWANYPVNYLNTDLNVDGVFVDSGVSILNRASTSNKLKEMEIYDEAVSGLHSMMNMLQTKLGNSRFSIVNCMNTPSLGDMYLDCSEGFMLEHFTAISHDDKDSIVTDIELIKSMAEKNRVLIVKAWPTFNAIEGSTGYDKYTELDADERIAQSKEDIVFPLACFLVGAGKYSYFCYSWYYTDTSGSLVDYEEYSKPLGEPLGEYERDGYVFTREFEHCSVWVDVESRTATIDWDE